jgi:archaellum component FlaF (FlaF/FlaG flagellin family)
VCKPNCADLPIEPKNKKKQIVSNTKSSCPKNIKVTLEKKGAKTKTTEKSTVLKK